MKALKKVDIDREDLYSNIIENNWNAITFANMEGIVEFTNPASDALYGYEEGELIGENVDIFNSHLTHNTEDIVNSLMEKGHWYGELIQRRKDNSTFEALLHVQIIKNKEGIPIGYASNSKDITADKVTATKLKQIIDEKEILIREIHHRVKNNLSIVQGMLRLQQSTLKQTNLNDFLLDFQGRLSVIAEAHNNLSKFSAKQEINLRNYMEKIIDDVSKLFAGQEDVAVTKDIVDVVIPIDLAIPIGIISNEVMTNAFKHAYNGKPGKLDVSLSNGSNECCLTIKDSGPSFDFKEDRVSETLGLSLVDGLVSQLGGTYSIQKNGGTEFVLNFSMT